MADKNDERNNRIREYFLAGLSYSEIKTMLCASNIHISIRQVNRVLRSMNLFRRGKKSSTNDILNAIHKEILGSGQCFGYRLMTQKLRMQGYNVDRETVRISLNSLDPEGVEQRSIHRFRRRKYRSVGPNYIWHLDGYDKLKKFGFAVHGGIDGWSRKVLWLKVASSNNNPNIIALYFIKCVDRLHLVPRCIRVDRGSENVVTGGMQRFFRRHGTDNSAGDESFRYGPSTSNQRIESWWSQFRRNRSNYWINLFKDMCDSGILETDIDYHIASLRFCFMGLLQTELDETVYLWNTHRIRKVRNSECPAGRPDVTYAAPRFYGGIDQQYPIDSTDLRIATGYIEEPSLFGCSNDMLRLIGIIMYENDSEMPTSVDEAVNLFILLTQEMYNLF